LVGLLDYWGVNKVHLVGCSMGGGTCFEVALDYPEWVASLTLVCSAPHGLELDAPEDAGLQALFRAVETAWQAGDVEQTAELEMRIWYDGVGRTPAETESPARRLALAMNRQALLYEQQGIGKRKAKTPPYAGQRLTELQVPLCMIVGQLDEPYSLVAADYLAAHIAGAQKFIIPHTAHLPSLERPAEFNALLAQFLGQPA
jgi:pimeloyl-ACP methyl ester carboxylesterase